MWKSVLSSFKQDPDLDKHIKEVVKSKEFYLESIYFCISPYVFFRSSDICQIITKVHYPKKCSVKIVDILDLK